MTDSDPRVTVQWLGDISLNEQLCSPHYHELIRARVAKLVEEAPPCDLRVGNFEAPLWGDGPVNARKSLRLCTTKEAARCILPLKLDAVFLGNNHVYDCLEQGFENTRAFLDENHIRHLGAGGSQAEAAQPLILERNGLRLGFLNFLHRNTNPKIPPEAGVHVNYVEQDRTIREIAELARRVDLALIYLHWGDEELVRLPNPAQRRFGRLAVEAGARVVVFDHAHCLQPHEPWKGGHVFYGLGNFVFGHVPGQDCPDIGYRTAMASITVTRETVENVRLDYLYSKGGIPAWDRRGARSRSQRRLNRRVQFPDGAYGVAYRCEKFHQRVIVSAGQFVKRSGGLIPSLLKVRGRHFGSVARAVVGFRKSAAKGP